MNARAEKGAFSSAGRVRLGLLVAYLVTGYVGHVQRAGQVVDDGVQYALHTLVLEALPARTGKASPAMVSLRIPALISSMVSSSPSRYFSISSSLVSATASTSSVRRISAWSRRSSGISSYSTRSHGFPYRRRPSPGSAQRASRSRQLHQRTRSPAPMGKLITSGVACRRSRMVLTE